MEKMKRKKEYSEAVRKRQKPATWTEKVALLFYPCNSCNESLVLAEAAICQTSAMMGWWW